MWESVSGRESGEDPSLLAFGLRRALGLPGPAFPLRPLAPRKDVPTLRLHLGSALLALASLETWLQVCASSPGAASGIDWRGSFQEISSTLPFTRWVWSLLGY